VRAKVPDLLERAASADAAEKAKLHEDLWASVEAGTLKESELTWISALLRGAVNAKVRTLVYLDARRWWYEAEDEALRESGKKILAEMGEEFLRDWPRILARIADSPDEVILFDPELMTSSRGGTEEGQVSAAAIAELAEMGIPEVVPILVDIATDYNADAAARKAAISAVGKLRAKLKK
jgi:HEAT repeat protein